MGDNEIVQEDRDLELELYRRLTGNLGNGPDRPFPGGCEDRELGTVAILRNFPIPAPKIAFQFWGRKSQLNCHLHPGLLRELMGGDECKVAGGAI